MNDGTLPVSKNFRNTPFLPTRCSCPIYSSIVRGRRRSAKGADMAGSILIRAKIGIFQKLILYLSNILTNTESVSLFPNRERRKFIAARNRQTSCRVVSVFCGYRRGGCCLFWLQRYPTTCDSEMGFGTTLSFLFMLPGCGQKNWTQL